MNRIYQLALFIPALLLVSCASVAPNNEQVSIISTGFKASAGSENGVPGFAQGYKTAREAIFHALQRCYSNKGVDCYIESTEKVLPATASAIHIATPTFKQEVPFLDSKRKKSSDKVVRNPNKLT